MAKIWKIHVHSYEKRSFCVPTEIEGERVAQRDCARRTPTFQVKARFRILARTLDFSYFQELESKQEEMLRENLELKELCLYLDKERENGFSGGAGLTPNGQRDQGDGSSSSTVDGQSDGIVTNGRQHHLEQALNRQRGGLNGTEKTFHGLRNQRTKLIFCRRAEYSAELKWLVS